MTDTIPTLAETVEAMPKLAPDQRTRAAALHEARAVLAQRGFATNRVEAEISDLLTLAGYIVGDLDISPEQADPVQVISVFNSAAPNADACNELVTGLRALLAGGFSCSVDYGDTPHQAIPADRIAALLAKVEQGSGY